MVLVGKYSAGDKVRIDGIVWTVGSWPENDEGPFTAHYINREGGDVYSTMWAGQVNVETDAHGNAITVADGGVGEPAVTSAQVELVEKGDGVASTLGEIHDELAEVDAELEAALQAKNEADPA